MDVEIAGKAYELERFDMAAARMVEKINGTADMGERYKLVWEFLRCAIGRDALSEVAGASTLAKCDLIALEVAFGSVIRAYQAPLQADAARAINEQLDGIDIDGMTRLLALAGKVGSRQGFSRVV